MSTVDCVTEEPGRFRHRLSVREHVFHTDLTRDEGGDDAGPDAHEYFSASLAACKALTAIWYAKRHGIPLERVESHVETDNREERSGRYKLLVRLAFHGPLTAEQRDRLYAAVERCPVAKLMTTTEVLIETAPLGSP